MALVQKKDKDGKPVFDDKGSPVMEEGQPNLDPAEVARQMKELQDKTAELQKNYLAQTERANRAEALLQSYVKGGAPAPGANGSGAPAGDPYAGGGIDPSQLVTEPGKVLGAVVKQAVSEAVQIMEKRYMEAEKMKMQSEGIRSKFYKDNADLVGFEKLVGFAEDEVRVSYPNVPYLELIPMIAQKARAEVVALKAKFGGGGGGQPPLGLENGGGQPAGGGAPAPAGQPSDEEEFAAYMKERAAKRKLG